MFLCRRASRYGEPGGVRPGGAWLQDAVPSRVPRIAAWPDADLLEERARGEAHLRVPAGLPGGLLHLHGASVPAGREPVTGLNMEMCMRHACAKLSMCIYFRVHRRMNECVCVCLCVCVRVCMYNLTGQEAGGILGTINSSLTSRSVGGTSDQSVTFSFFFCPKSCSDEKDLTVVWSWVNMLFVSQINTCYSRAGFSTFLVLLSCPAYIHSSVHSSRVN